MSKTHDDRRSVRSPDEAGPDSMSDTVRTALLIQSRNGTVSAIEYMKLGEVPSGVIERIAAGTAIRAEDSAMLAAVSTGAPV